MNGDGNAAPVLRSVRRFSRQRLAGVLRQRRLGVERVDVRRPAVQEEVDDALRLAGKVRLLAAPADWPAAAASVAVVASSARQAERAQAHAGALQQLAAA